MSDAVQPPQSLTFDTDDGPLTVHALDIYRRLPALEAQAAFQGTPVAAVFALVHHSEANGRKLRAGAARLDDGRIGVFIVMNRAQCPIIRLGLLEHECEHIRRGDVTNGLRAADHAEAEADADAAAELAIRSWSIVATAASGVPVNATKCVSCYHAMQPPCLQGGTVFEAVTARLHRY